MTPRALGAPRPDGGTACGAQGSPATWQAWASGAVACPPEARTWAALLADSARELSAEEERSIAASGGRLALLEVGGTSEIGILSVSGMRRSIIRLAFRDRCELRVNRETGAARIEFRAKLLWRGDWRAEITRWLDGLAWALGLSGLVGDGDACAWECTRLELACDFIDLPITAIDRPAVQTRSKVSIHDTTRTDDPDPDDDPDPEIETLAIGSRASACSISVYDKTLQVNIARRGENAPNYVAAWQAGGWVGAIGDDGRLVGPAIRRVEVRLKDRALELIDAEEERGTQATSWNLRTPARMMSRDALAVAWRWATTDVHRLVLLRCEKTGEDFTRRRRAPTDPRWEAVQKAASLEDPFHPLASVKQSRRQRDDIHAERLRRSERRITLAIEEYAAQHGIDVTSIMGRMALAEYARANLIAREIVDPVRWRERYAAEHDASISPCLDDARRALARWLAIPGAWQSAPSLLTELRPVRVSLLAGRPELVSDDLNWRELALKMNSPPADREEKRGASVDVASSPWRDPLRAPRASGGAPRSEGERVPPPEPSPPDRARRGSDR
ncbi:MAG: hypothetical protein A2V88_04355 [Elusimicrobia bacterium RBG_16_66_12]|nr:MAG: hypothetical protein A2V88_04355 [Elusimicrobia bacterium RBG_16_66_12]